MTAELIRLTTGLIAALDGLPRRPTAYAVLAVGVLAFALLARAALQSSGAVRRAWAAVAVACAGWGAGNAALLLGAPMAWNWWLVRPVTLTALAVGILSFPGVRRPIRDWLVLLGDGWMLVGGFFVVAWMHLHSLPGVEGYAVRPVEAAWLVLDMVVLSTVAGLLSLAAAGHRAPVVYVMVAGLLGGLADLLLVITDSTASGAVFWCATVLLVGAAPLVGDGQMFSTTFVDPDQRRVIRLSQLPLVPAFYVTLTPVDRDVVASLGSLSVLLILFANVAVHSTQNARLLGTVQDQSARYRQLLGDSRDAIVQLDDAGRIEFVNDAASTVLGHPDGELLGRSWFGLLHLADVERVRAEFAAVDTCGSRVEARIRDASGAVLHAESTVNRRAGTGGWVLSTRDVTDRVRLRGELEHQARTDPLTGLLNRHAFLALAGERLAGERQALVLFVDLDGFKSVNDTLGHAAGDELLRDVADRLRSAVAPGDAIARLGGDEFAVLTRSSQLHHATATAAALIDVITRLEQPVRGRVRTSASIGIATGRGIPAAQLLREADLAMYRAKGGGGGRAVVFETWMSDRVLERSRMRSRLEHAIEDRGLRLELQPVVRLGSGTWSGFEALIRWQDGEVRRAPDEFLPLAEESGLMVPMGTWVLREALRQLAAWPDPAAGIAVNVSPRQLEEDGFAHVVTAALEDTRTAPDRLTLEITEQTAVEDLGRTASGLAALRDRGVHVAVDDFGTGFSSMRYLTRLPVDALKIDRQFVDGLGVRPEDEVLVLSMIRLAADLRLEVIAEGVETQAQADLLLRHGCRLAQGYLFSPPRPVAELRRIHDAGGDRGVLSGTVRDAPRR